MRIDTLTAPLEEFWGPHPVPVHVEILTGTANPQLLAVRHREEFRNVVETKIKKITQTV